MNASRPRPGLPPIFGIVLRPLQQFFGLEAASGIVLLAMALTAFVWANWPSSSSYHAFVETRLALELGPRVVGFTPKELVNDGLMTFFFFVVGLEIKRELVRGELRSPARALLPAIAALGGMFAPAAVFLLFNHGSPARAGWGIPMATDIAFTIGCLALVRSRVPHGLVVFVTALAIFDDIGGILVIAIFYGSGLQAAWLGAAVVVVGIGVLLNRYHVRSWVSYAVVGVLLWFALHHSGIHATIAGVALGMLVPARPRRSGREVLGDLGHYATLLARGPDDEDLAVSEIAAIEEKLEDLQSPLDRFVHWLGPIVAYGIMPLFALVNAGVRLSGGAEAFASPVALGVGLGLLVGKQIGIFLATLLAVRLGAAPMPGDCSTAKLYGVSVVAGIGFTVALFIAALAFPRAPELLDQAKLGILVGSLLAGALGLAILRMTPPVRVSVRPAAVEAAPAKASVDDRR